MTKWQLKVVEHSDGFFTILYSGQLPKGMGIKIFGWLVVVMVSALYGHFH